MAAYNHLSDFHEGDWSVSPLLRHLLERKGNLRHAECCLVNRKILRTGDLTDMNEHDIRNLIIEVEAIWNVLRWNTGRVSWFIFTLVEDAKAMQTNTHNAFARESFGVSRELLSGMSCSRIIRNPETLLRFSKYFMQASSAESEQLDPASASTRVGTASDSMQALVKHVDAAKELLSQERVKRIIEQVQVSDAHAAESAAALARALEFADELPLPMDDTTVSEERNPRKIVKNAKRALRNVFLWACIGWAKGLDSLEALENRFPQGGKAQETRAQLLNGFMHLRQAISMQLTGQDQVVALTPAKPKRSKRESVERPSVEHTTIPPIQMIHGELSSRDPEVCRSSNLLPYCIVGGPTAHTVVVYASRIDDDMHHADTSLLRLHMQDAVMH